MNAQLPDEYEPTGEGDFDENDNSEFDIESLRVNFSKEESESEGRSYEVLPAGNYPVHITKVEIRKVKKEGPNRGKPFYNIHLTVNEGHQHAGRVFFGSVMLFDGALYSLAQLEKALGWSQEDVDSGKVITPDELLGEELTVFVKRVRDAYAMQGAEAGTPTIYKNDVSSYLPAKGVTTQGEGSLMP